jgi:PAS domain S-box-containing protein
MATRTTGVCLAVTFLSVTVACAISWMAGGTAPSQLHWPVFFLAAVVISTGIGGLRFGVLATVLSVLCSAYFFLPPDYSFAIRSSDAPTLTLFALVALLINGTGEQLQARTRAADQRFHDLVQTLEGIVWEADARTLQFTFVNRRAETMLGYPIVRWLQDPEFRLSIVHVDDRRRVMQMYEQVLVDGSEHECEYRVVAADGQEVWLRESVRARHKNGIPICLNGLCVDITERVQATNELSVVKDELAALNQLINAISTSLEMPQVIANLKQHLSTQLAIPSGALYLAVEGDNHLKLVASWGTSQVTTSEWIHPGADGVDQTPVLWQSANAPVVTLPLLANGVCQGRLYLDLAATGAGSRYRPAFFSALGRQVGVVIENARLYQQVQSGREHMQALSRKLVQVQETERRQIARELHDEIGQVLTGLKLHLEISVRQPPDAVHASLSNALSLINDLMDHVRNLSLDLRPAMLDDLGLMDTLLWYFGRYTALTHVKVLCEHTGMEHRFPFEVETTAYRIVQEALTNVARHASVETVTVRVWATSELLGLKIIDEGCGFNPTEALNGYKTGGLTGMKERADLLGGLLSIESTPGAGVRITAELPAQGYLQEGL